MDDLVTIKNGEALTTSILIAERFEKSHDRVLKAIDSLRESISEVTRENKRTQDVEYSFVDRKRVVRGREFRYVEMNRNAFSLLGMGFTGKKALFWKMNFVEAFNKMEALLLNFRDPEWSQVRIDSKTARLEFTGCIKEFVEYATSQGSNSANKYYMNLTKMEYAALKMIEYREKIPSNYRDTLDRMQLHMLVMAEHVANETIKEGMNDQLHYKEIFLLAKQAVLKYADTVLFEKRIGN